jgi:RHS repeat-associated protein
VGTLQSLTYPGGRRVDYAVNAINRPTSVAAILGGTSVLASGFSYDGSGNVLSYTLGNGLIPTYAYDAANRVSSIAVPGVTNRILAYDNVGNITSVDDSLSSAPSPSFGPTTYAYQANRLMNVTEGSSTRTYQYDPSGHPTADGAREFIYDQKKRLKQVLESSVVRGAYIYDGRGRRVLKTAAGGTTVFHYDLSGRLIEETDGAGNLLVDYVYLEGTPLAMVRKTGTTEATYYYHTDHLGTPKTMTDQLQTIVWKVDTDPFGNEVGTPIKTIENNLRFPGQYFDQETGLHQNYFRDYDPKTGRYIQPDPIGLKGGINPYSYSKQNPVNRIDKLGLEDCSEKDCESGEWIMDQGGTGSASLIVGYSRTPVEFRCKGGKKMCRGVLVCSSIGLQAGIGFQWNIDFESIIGTGSIIKNVINSGELKDYISSSWNIDAGIMSTSGNNIAIGPSVGFGISKQWCMLENFSCR